jgi:hypothetical protein
MELFKTVSNCEDMESISFFDCVTLSSSLIELSLAGVAIAVAERNKKEIKKLLIMRMDFSLVKRCILTFKNGGGLRVNLFSRAVGYFGEKVCGR